MSMNSKSILYFCLSALGVVIATDAMPSGGWQMSKWACVILYHGLLALKALWSPTDQDRKAQDERAAEVAKSWKLPP